MAATSTITIRAAAASSEVSSEGGDGAAGSSTPTHNHHHHHRHHHSSAARIHSGSTRSGHSTISSTTAAATDTMEPTTTPVFDLPDSSVLEPSHVPHAMPNQHFLEDPAERVERDVAAQIGVDVDEDCAPTHVPRKDRCKYVGVVHECLADVNFVDYLDVYYCKTNDSQVAQVLMQLASCAWLAVLFQCLAVVAERFLVPAIRVLADHWKLPPDVAGVTLLSMAAGAPDIFTELAAVNTGEKVDYLLAVSSVVGSALFINCVVFAVVCLGGDGMRIPNARAYIRDAGTNLLATIAVAVVSQMKSLGWLPSALLLTMYVAYIVVIFAFKPFFNAAGVSLEAESSMATLTTTAAATRSPGRTPPASPRVVGTAAVAAASTSSHATDNSISGMLRRFWHRTQDPMAHLIALTMPEMANTASTGIRRMQAVRMAFFTPLFLLFVIGFTPSQYGMHTYCVVAVSCVLLSCTLVTLAYGTEQGNDDSEVDVEAKRNGVSTKEGAAGVDTPKPESPEFAVRLALYIFLLSGLWMNLVANELVAVLHALGHANGLSQDFLGVSILGIGESVGDFVAMLTVARQGEITTAISACFAGPAFNMLVGLSVAFLYYIAVHQTPAGSSGPATRIRTESTPLLTTLLLFTIAVNSYALIAVPLAHEYKLTRRLGVGCLLAYGAFLVAAAIIAHYE